MNDDDVPVKTDQGVAEIQTRKIGLARRIRTALLLVDGVKSVGELNRLIQTPDEEQRALDILLGQGLIQYRSREPINVPAPKPIAVATLDVKPVAEPEPELEPEPEPEPKLERKPAPKPKAKREIGPNTAIKRNTRIKLDTKIKPDTQLNTKAKLNPRTRTRIKVKPELTNVVQPAPLLIEERLKSRSPPAAAVVMASVAAAPVAAPPVVVRHDMKLTVARAHLANALDDHLGIDGYILKQEVMRCTTHEELEALFDTIEKDLRPVIYSVAALNVIFLAKSILKN